jgi:hypothetical protein
MGLRSRRLRRVDVERERARNAGDDSGVLAIQSAEQSKNFSSASPVARSQAFRCLGSTL